MANPLGLTGYVLRAALALALVWSAGPASAADRFVATTGDDSANDCPTSTAPCRTIAHAVAQAASGDEVKVAFGTYQETVAVNASTTLTISGGWALGFGSRDPQAHRTTLAHSSIGVSAGGGQTVDLDLDGLYFRGGIAGALCPGPFCALEPAISAQGSADGAIHLTVSDCQFVQAGGISARHGGTGSVDLTVTGSRFTVGRGAGAGVSADADGTSTINVTVEESTFARGHGGGISFGSGSSFSTPTRSLTVDRCVFVHNRTGAGGAISVGTIFDSGTMNVVVTNSFMARNTVRDVGGSGGVGGAMAILGGHGATMVMLVSDTIVRNSTGSDTTAPFGCRGGGLYASGSETVDLTDVILWGNRAGTATDDVCVVAGAVVDADHDDIGDRVTPSGTFGTFNDLGGNVSVDPQLVGGFELSSTSPLIDAGTCTGAPSTDIEGDPRPSGAGCDIGADEFVP